MLGWDHCWGLSVCGTLSWWYQWAVHTCPPPHRCLSSCLTRTDLISPVKADKTLKPDHHYVCLESTSCMTAPFWWRQPTALVALTSTEQVAAMTPSTGLSENGSNVRSGRLMKSGLSRYLQIRMKKHRCNTGVAFTNQSAPGKHESFSSRVPAGDNTVWLVPSCLITLDTPGFKLVWFHDVSNTGTPKSVLCNLPTVSIVLKLALIELHCKVRSLKV